ncbi:MAG: TolC family protein [Sedimentibacter sp.]
MKRKIALLMAMVLLMTTMQVNFASAEEETTEVPVIEVTAETTEEPVIEVAEETIAQPMELSIEQAIQLATDSDRGMWKIDDAIKQMQDARSQGKDAKDQAETLIGMSFDQIAYVEEITGESLDITSNYVETLMAKNGYYIKSADTQMEMLKKNKDLLTVGIEIKTKSLYYSVLVAEKTIEINEEKIKSANEQLRVINLKFNNGSATKAEVLNVEMSVQQAKTDLDSANDDLKMAELNLLNALDLSFDTEIELTDNELNYVPTQEINLCEAVEKAKLERAEILAAENKLELQEIKTHVYTAYYTSNLRQNKAAKEDLKDAELNVPQAYKDVDLDVRKSYLNLVKSERALTNMDKTVELAREAARINKLLYENGMVASVDVIKADSSLAQAEIGRYQLLVAYNINKLMFDNSDLISSSSDTDI